MATSGTFRSSIGAYLHLDLDWAVKQTDVAGNRSLVTLTLKLSQTGNGIYFSANKTGVLQGTSFTYTGGFNGTGTKTLSTRDVWIVHNSDGSKTQKFSATFNIAINYSGSNRTSMSVSGDAILNSIPRASSITSFSFSKVLVSGSTTTAVNLSLSRASTTFRHDISLRDGTYVIASWSGQALPTSLSLTSSQVNDMLSRMSTVTSKSFTLRVQTKSGTTNIGSAVTRTATATVWSGDTPTASNLSIDISGSGRDTTIGKYIQNVSKVYASFTGTAPTGATVSSRTIVIKKLNSSVNTMTISGASGTSGVLTSSGTYEVVATVTDSRGRTDTQETTFTVHAYSPPKIVSFNATRNASTDTTVNITRNITFSPLGTGDNTLTIKTYRKPNDANETEIQSRTTTSSPYTTGLTSTGNSSALSFVFRLRVTDSFGNSTEAIQVVPTAKVVLDIHKNEGIGIGKMHQRGSLDVGGDVYINDSLIQDFLSTYFADSSHNHSDSIPIPANADLDNYKEVGLYRTQNNTITQSISNCPTGLASMIEVLPSYNTGSFMQRLTTYTGSATWQRTYYSPTGNWYSWKPISVDLDDNSLVDSTGSNTNGRYIRFKNGIQICWGEGVALAYQSGLWMTGNWTYPKSFSANPVVIGNHKGLYTTSIISQSSFSIRPRSTTYAQGILMSNAGASFTSDMSWDYQAIALGTW